MDEIIPSEPLFITVNGGYTFEVIQQDGCVSQCMLLGVDEVVPENFDELANQAIEIRVSGVIIGEIPPEIVI